MKAILLLTLSAASAMAHHGQDFFVTLDTRVPAQNAFSAFGTAVAGEHDFSLETGLIVGLGANFAAGLTVDFSDAGSFQPNGITPMLQWSAPLGDIPLRIGAAFSYHVYDSSRSLGGGHSHEGHSHGGHSHARVSENTIPTDQFLFSFNPDAPPAPEPVPVNAADSGSSTIHLHDEDYFLARLILEYEWMEHTRVVGNLIIAGTSSSDTAIGYALAVRHSLSERWAAGLEAIGDFNVSGYHQLVIGIIHSPRHDLGVRLGISHGLGSSEDGAACLVGTTWRF